MNQDRKYRNLSTKPLLSIEETAVLLGQTRSTLYRAIQAHSVPFPVFTIGNRLRVPRRAIERLLEGLDPCASEISESEYQSQKSSQKIYPVSDCITPLSRRRPTCSAARRSSFGTESV